MSYLSSEENKNISRRFSEMDLHDSYVRCVQIVRLWLSKLVFHNISPLLISIPCVENLNRKCSTRDRENRRLVEVLGEFDCVQSGTKMRNISFVKTKFQIQRIIVIFLIRVNKDFGKFTIEYKFLPSNDKFELRSFLGSGFEQAKENVSVDGSFVGLIQHDQTVVGQIGVDQALAQQHAVRHVLDDSVLAEIGKLHAVIILNGR